ncbi:uncharacterized protein CDAR_61 [Caerostris darwini]|uniref:Uncharacterized protein n=1 Tax=Caerostris darwini TaxID=1538125 RepID=A0AAV4TRQ3_9ARAC|nr:uncharacterized protein CDAR_61 [Caerostris darwini]
MSILRFSKSQFKQSMLTGIPQIIQARGTLRKLLKSFVLIVCFVCCLYQVWSYMEVYWKYPVIVDVYASNPSSITLPAFTVCEYNGIKRSKFCRSYPNLCTPKKSYKDFCQTNSALCMKNLVEPEDKVRNEVGIHPCYSILKIESVNNTMGMADLLKAINSLNGKKRKLVKEINYRFFLDAIHSTRELPRNFSKLREKYRRMGTTRWDFVDEASHGEEELTVRPVFVFNLQGLPTNCFAYNTVLGNGSAVLIKEPQRTGFDISLATEGNDHFYFSTPYVIQMAVHSPFMIVNPFTEGFSIQPCTTYKMYLRKTIKTLLPPPYPTNCTDYVTLWRARGGYGPLNKEMCSDECLFNKSMEMTGCINPMIVTYPNDNAPFCFGGPTLEKELEDCNLNCGPACYEEEMEVKIEEFAFSSTEEKKEAEKCKTGIKLSFVRTKVMAFMYTQKYQGVEAFGYIGGFLGMWLGLSLIAVCDFLETCLSILLHVCKKQRFLRLRKNNNVMKMKMQKQRVFFI